MRLLHYNNASYLIKTKVDDFFIDFCFYYICQGVSRSDFCFAVPRQQDYLFMNQTRVRHLSQGCT